MKAVIQTSGVQYTVEKGDELLVDSVGDEKTLTFEALMLIDDDKSKSGADAKGATVKAKVVESDVKGDKVIAIRFKSKKRVHKRRGHRQKLSKIQITDIRTK